MLLGGTWSVSNWAFNAFATRYGEFSVLFGNDPAVTSRDEYYDAQWVLDLSATYTLDKWNFTLGGDNVLDSYPDEVLFPNSTNGQIVYSASSPNGFNGAYMYAKVGYKW